MGQSIWPANQTCRESTNRVNQRGFTLTELAVVLVIVALLIGGMMLPLGAQTDLRRNAETQKNLEDIRDALLGFAAVNGRLPCPALATIPSGTIGAGLEPSPILAGGCANSAGVLPWATLGVSETDAWGNRFTYRITALYTRQIGQASFGCSIAAPNPNPNPPTPPSYAAFALCSPGDMKVLNPSGTTIADLLPVVVVSHGKNGNGAYTPQGTQLPLGADANELNNQLTSGGTDTANKSFISSTPTTTFDDLVLWIPPAILFNRMIAAGRLP